MEHWIKTNPLWGEFIGDTSYHYHNSCATFRLHGLFKASVTRDSSIKKRSRAIT